MGFKFSVCFSLTINGLLAFVIEPNSIVLYRLGFAFEDTAVCHTTQYTERVIKIVHRISCIDCTIKL